MRERTASQYIDESAPRPRVTLMQSRAVDVSNTEQSGNHSFYFQENLLNDIGHLWKSCINHIYQSREPVKEMGLCEAVIVGSALVVVRQGK